MGTKSSIHYELKDGCYSNGVYCHYDGYPAHMIKALRAVQSYSDIKKMCRDGRISGGLRCVNDDGTYETIGVPPRSSRWSPVGTNFPDGNYSHSYLVKLDGSIVHYGSYDRKFTLYPCPPVQSEKSA